MKSFSIAHSEASLGWGGQEIRVFHEMLAMRQRGHRMVLLAPMESQIAKNAAKEAVEVIGINTEKLRYPLTILEIAREFRKRQVEIVNTHSSRDGWLAGIAAKLTGVRLLLRSRHIDVDYPNRFVSRITFGMLPNLTLTTSEKIRKKLIDELGIEGEKVISVPTGIDFEKYSPQVPGILHAELGLSPNTPLIGVVAVLRSWKGHLDFLEAASIVLKINPEVHFVFAGDGPMKAKIERKRAELGLERNVILLGHRSDVPQVLASLHAVVLPSYAHEGIPQVLLQAQAMGRPVIGTDAGGIPEIVAHEKTGLIVPAREPEALANAMLRVVNARVGALKLAATAREQVLNHHGIERMCEILEAIYLR